MRAFVTLALAGCLAGPVAATARLHDNTADGAMNPPAAGVISPLYLRLVIAGDTPGVLTTVVQQNNSGVIVGGEWTLTVGADDAPTGTLTGTFSAGQVEFLGDGSPLSVTKAALVIQSGTGDYADVTEGEGTLDGTFGGSNFTGRLGLTF
jgi:hypothetical protein